MSKFCVNCGTQMDDDGVFCPSCGSRQEDPVVETPAPAAPAPVAKKKLSRKQLLIGGGILAVVIIAVLAFILLQPGPATAVENFGAVYNGDFSKIEALAPAEYWTTQAKQNDTSKSKYLQEYTEEYREEYVENVEYWEDRYGKNPEVSCKMLDKEDVDKDVVMGIAKTLEETYNIDADKVKSVCKVIIKLSIKGADSSDIDAKCISAIQIGSDWYLINYYENQGKYSVRFMLP